MIDYKKLKWKQRKQAQDFTVNSCLEQLLKISHEDIPNGSRACRITLTLDVPNTRRYLRLDFSPLHSTYVIREAEQTKLSLVKP